MLNKPDNNGDNNFWISYADLMAGLLFVFILLLGVIVSKTTILKNALNEKETRLSHLSSSLRNKEISLADINNSLHKSNRLLGEKDKSISSAEKTLKLKNEEIGELKSILASLEATKNQNIKEIALLSRTVSDANKTIEEKNRMLSDIKNKHAAYVLSIDKDMSSEKSKYAELILKMQEQNRKIKSLTGIKLKVITALKNALGDNINIDKKSGSLRLSSNILFDKGSSILKEGAKEKLKKAFENYVGTLVGDEEIKSHIDKIIIEGHTDSDGEYLYNLNLSQKRAFSVMNYLLTLELTQKEEIKSLMTASGRAYLDAIVNNGIEDKNASRRIEIKFRLKNENAINEIEKVLDAK